MQSTFNAALAAHGDGTRELIRRANGALPADVLRRLGLAVAKGGTFACPSCKSQKPSATFKGETGDYGRRWRCTADGCDAGGTLVDLIATVKCLDDANAARWILGMPTVPSHEDKPPESTIADIPGDDAGEFFTSTKVANAVENEVPAIAGNESRAEINVMSEYSPNGADGPRASNGAAESVFERAKAVPLTDVLSRLGIPFEGHKFLCQFHDDHNPSADFRDKATGKAHSHWQCFACKAKGSGVDLVAKRMSLEPAAAARWILNESSPVKNSHAANGKPVSKPGEPAKGKPPKIHETPDKAIRALLYSVRKAKGDENWHVVGGWRAYHVTSGEVVLGVVRFEDGKGEKTFRQFSRKGDGWIAKGPSSGIPPFRLPELDKAKPLVVVEGEKTCDAAWEIGLQSTTWAGGAPAVKKTDWSLLAGFDVIVWPDADEPGRKAAADVAKALHGIAARVRILPDDHDASEGDDAADTLAAMGQEKALEHFRDRLERAIDWMTPQPATSGFPQPGNGKPQVIFPLNHNDPSMIFAQIIPHLADAGVYYRDGSLCRIIQGDSINIRGVSKLSVSGPMIDTHDADSILPVLCKAIDFQAEYWRGEALDIKPITPKVDFIRWFLRLRKWRGTPFLAGVTSGPFLRHDGTVCTTPGYDAASGWYLDYDGEPIEVPDHPTKEQAKNACRELLALVDDFEWKSEAQSCGFLAHLLTLAARPSIEGPVPAFVFTASTLGAGKTKLANISNIITLGSAASIYTPPQARHASDSAEEWRKMLFAHAETGIPSLVVDNYPSGMPVGNAAIDGVVSSTKMIGRTLQKTKVRESAWVAVMVFTGNNLSCTADFAPRSIWAVLEPTWENPRERTGFKIPELEEYVRKHRAKLLGYVLTILRWHAAEGKPKAGGKNAGTFEEWASTVRDPIMHLTGHDVTQNGRDAIITDQEADELASLLGGLREYYEWRKAVGKPRQPFTVAELHGDLNDPANASAWSDLREVVDASLSFHAFNTSVGKSLPKYRGRVSGGMKLNVSTVNDKRYWRIDMVKTSPTTESEGGISGDIGGYRP